VRPWSPKGETPLLLHCFNWRNLGAIAGLTWSNFHFRLFAGSIKSPQVLEFLGHLQRHLPGKLLIIWDGAAIHRSTAVRQYLEALEGQVIACRLPADAPELNPVEDLPAPSGAALRAACGRRSRSARFWAYWKQHELPNLCARDLWSLSGWAAHGLRRIRRKRHRLIIAFWKQAELWP
jgi:hypothetical protein